MARVVGIGHQDFESVRVSDNFYIDKTHFIREWWEAYDAVTLITRPRRFGKTLTMSMVEQFFSVEYANRKELFEGLSIWQEEAYRNLRGTYPVISLNFAKVKETSFLNTRKKICNIITKLYNRYDFLLDSGKLNGKEKELYQKVSADMEDYIASDSLNMLSDYLMRYYGKKVIILLDEYDTPMQEAYVGGYWEEMVEFIRNLFNATFKTNPYMERAIMTGITRVSKESVFSDLNNLEVITTTSEKYADCFGFTEEEVFRSLDEYGLSTEKEEVKKWYDGFCFGGQKDIYNPWSILNYLDKKRVGLYWANTSSNSLVGKLIREGEAGIKIRMEQLLQGESLYTVLDEQIVFNQLDQGEDAVWSLLLASGYLKAVYARFNTECRKMEYELRLTNLEVQVMFEHMIEGWFQRCRPLNNAFLQALTNGDLEEMNDYMNDISEEMFSSFDTGKNPSEKTHPERFYHGFVLGLMVELRGRYEITSNGESGLGRHDVMIVPKEKNQDAYVIEFKVANTRKRESLESAVSSALEQIEKRKYESALRARGFAKEQIKKYGFAFRGKEVLIGAAEVG